MERWLEDFLEKHRATNDLLRNLRIEGPADTRDALLDRLEEAAREADSRTVSVAEAAIRTGVVEETVRRAIRNGEVTDLREKSGQRIRVLVSELPILRGKARSVVDKDAEESYPSVTDITARMRGTG